MNSTRMRNAMQPVKQKENKCDEREVKTQGVCMNIYENLDPKKMETEMQGKGHLEVGTKDKISTSKSYQNPQSSTGEAMGTDDNLADKMSEQEKQQELFNKTLRPDKSS